MDPAEIQQKVFSSNKVSVLPAGRHTAMNCQYSAYYHDYSSVKSLLLLATIYLVQLVRQKALHGKENFQRICNKTENAYLCTIQ